MGMHYLITLHVVFCATLPVLGTVRYHTFAKDNGKRSTNVTDTLHGASEIECCRTCMETDGCSVVSYCPSSKTCELTHTPGAVATVVPQTGWDVYNNLNPACMTQWMSYGSSCLYLETEHLTLPDAQNNCEALVPSAHLVDLPVFDKDAFVRSWLLQRNTSDFVLLGALYNNSTGLFYWTDGTPIDAGYLGWGPGEPNAIDEHCVAAFHAYDFIWVDIMCDTPMQSICEYTLV